MATTNMRNPSSAELKEALATLYPGLEIDKTNEEVLLDSMRSDAVSNPRYRNLTPLEYVGLFKVDKGPCTTAHGVKDLDVVLSPGLVDSTQLEAGKAWRSAAKNETVSSVKEALTTVNQEASSKSVATQPDESAIRRCALLKGWNDAWMTLPEDPQDSISQQFAFAHYGRKSGRIPKRLSDRNDNSTEKLLAGAATAPSKPTLAAETSKEEDDITKEDGFEMVEKEDATEIEAEEGVIFHGSEAIEEDYVVI